VKKSEHDQREAIFGICRTRCNKSSLEEKQELALLHQLPESETYAIISPRVTELGRVGATPKQLRQDLTVAQPRGESVSLG
jgi:hypothetical protein